MELNINVPMRDSNTPVIILIIITVLSPISLGFPRIIFTGTGELFWSRNSTVKNKPMTMEKKINFFSMELSTGFQLPIINPACKGGVIKKSALTVA